MSKPKKSLSLFGVSMVALSLLVPTAVHAAEANEPQEVGEEYIVNSETDSQFGHVPEVANDSSSLIGPQTLPFTGEVKAHLTHKSGGDASGHVSWYLTSGTNQKTPVSSTLKARTSWLTFRTMVGPVTKEISAGGGAGNDAVARYTCNNSNNRDGYTFGEAYAPGASVPYGSHSSGVQEVACEGGLP